MYLTSHLSPGVNLNNPSATLVAKWPTRRRGRADRVCTSTRDRDCQCMHAHAQTVCSYFIPIIHTTVLRRFLFSTRRLYVSKPMHLSLSTRHHNDALLIHTTYLQLSVCQRQSPWTSPAPICPSPAFSCCCTGTGLVWAPTSHSDAC